MLNYLLFFILKLKKKLKINQHFPEMSNLFEILKSIVEKLKSILSDSNVFSSQVIARCEAAYIRIEKSLFNCLTHRIH